MSDIKVTVLTAIWNCADLIERSISNVKAQDYPNVEHIIVDGGSTDGTVKILQAQRHVRWISEPDKGIYDAWNKGVALSTGDWLIFLGADDFLASDDVISRIVDFIRAASTGTSMPQAVYGNIEILDPVTLVPVELRAIAWEDMKDKYEYLRPALPRFPEVFFHRSLMSPAPPFDTSYKIAGDTKFMLSVLRQGVMPAYVNFLVSRMTFGGTSARPETLWKTAIEIRRACNELGVKVPKTHLVKEWLKIISKVAILNYLPRSLANSIANRYRLQTGRGPLSRR